MSYVRWSKQSDVYIFDHVDGFIECCACCLDPVDADSFKAKNVEEMIEHVQVHRAAGHLVPDYVEEALRGGKNNYPDRLV